MEEGRGNEGRNRRGRGRKTTRTPIETATTMYKSSRAALQPFSPAAAVAAAAVAVFELRQYF